MTETWIEKETDIKALQPKEIDYMVGCGAGLWLHVRASGRKTFIIHRKQTGKTKIITQGKKRSSAKRRRWASPFRGGTGEFPAIRNRHLNIVHLLFGHM